MNKTLSNTKKMFMYLKGVNKNMFRKFAVILTTFVTSFFLVASPVRAESIVTSNYFNNDNQSSYTCENTYGLIEDIGSVIKTVGDIAEVVTAGGILICVAGGIASTTVFPAAAAILPYCSATAGGGAATGIVKERKKVWEVLNYAF